MKRIACQSYDGRRRGLPVRFALRAAAGRGPGGDRDPSGSLMYHGVHRYFETLLATLSCKR
jgi:hypothetical protein